MLAVPGGPNRPNRGAIPPVPPGPVHAPNLTPPTIEGLQVQEFQQVHAHAPSSSPLDLAIAADGCALLRTASCGLLVSVCCSASARWLSVLGELYHCDHLVGGGWRAPQGILPTSHTFSRLLTPSQGLQTFFQLLAQAESTSAAPPQLPPELSNVDQLRVLLDALPDYHADDEQPSYVLAIPCRPIVVGISALVPTMPCFASVNWGALLTHAGTTDVPAIAAQLCQPIDHRGSGGVT